MLLTHINLAASGLHTFLTHYVSNRFGEHPFAIMIQVALMYRLCYSLLLALKGTGMAGEVGLEPTMVCRRRLWRPVQSPLCDSPVYGGADENRTRVQNHLIIKYLFTHYSVFMYSFRGGTMHQTNKHNK